jgi:glutamine amidotransferase
MCRWLTYSGSSIYLETLLFEPENSLIHQSLHARKARVATNGDGFGLGWYGERDLPGTYHETLPAWNDQNLKSLAHQIRARLFFAHVRASTGTATTRANCHPFSHGRWMFMHNGQIGGYERIRRALEQLIPDEYYAQRQGTTDSELIFYLLFRYGLEADPALALERTTHAILEVMRRHRVAEAFRMTASLTDGTTVWAIRYATDADPPSLYYGRVADGLMVVSEPLDTMADHWKPVPPGHVLVAHDCSAISLHRFTPGLGTGMDLEPA